MMFKKIAIAGGPCSGKTTGLAYLSERLPCDFGYRPIIVPEIPTLVITGGISDINQIAIAHPKLYLEIQRAMFLLQSDYERRAEALARQFCAKGEKVVVICDRGKMDGRAYVDAAGFASIIGGEGLREHAVRESYDAVIHMVTAAKGAEAHYNTTNNKARRETLEEARIADDRTLDAWKDHSHLAVIDNYNSTSFDHKIRRLLGAVLNILGVPHPVEVERKFLLVDAPDSNIPELRGTQTSMIEQIYLVNPDKKEVRIRKRSFDGFDIFFETQKSAISPGVRAEIERQITADEYSALAKNQMPNTRIIRKTRRCFVYKDRRFELDEFVNPPGLCLLEVELADMSEKVELPPFLHVVREVTSDPVFSNYALAQIP